MTGGRTRAGAGWARAAGSMLWVVASCGGAPASTQRGAPPSIPAPSASSPLVASTPDSGAAGEEDAAPITEAGPDGVPVVRTGSRVPWMSVIAAIDRLVQAGGHRFILATADGTGPPSHVIDVPRPATHDVSIRAFTKVEMERDGVSLAVDGKRVAGFGEIATTLQGRRGDAVVIAADEATPFGRVLSLVNLAQEAGGPVLFGVSPVPLPTDTSGKPHVTSSWAACPFPPEADKAAIDGAFVVLEADIDATGHARAVRVIRDPGHGFGRVARECALAATFEPAHDGHGVAIDEVLQFRVTFTR